MNEANVQGYTQELIQNMKIWNFHIYIKSLLKYTNPFTEVYKPFTEVYKPFTEVYKPIY